MATSLAPHSLQPGILPEDVHAVTASLGDADTSIATTEFVENALNASTIYFDNYFTGLGTIGSPISLRALYFSSKFFGVGTIEDPIDFTVPLSSLVASTTGSTIDNGNNKQTWQWNSLGNNKGLVLESSSTAAAGNDQQLFKVSMTGTNATPTETTYAADFTNTRSGAGGVSVGLRINAQNTASGVAYALLVPTGSVGIGLNPTELLHVSGSIKTNSYFKSPSGISIGLVDGTNQPNYSLPFDIMNSTSVQARIGTITTTASGGRAILNFTVGNSSPTALPGWRLGLNTSAFNNDNFTIDELNSGTFIQRIAIQKTTGNVGLGTDSPAYKLTVAGDSNTTGNAYFQALVGIQTTNPTSSFQSLGSFSLPCATNTGGDTTMGGINYTMNCTVPITVTIPLASAMPGRIYIVKNSSAGTITINASGADTIDGLTSQSLTVQYSAYTLQSTGTTWIIIGKV